MDAQNIRRLRLKRGDLVVVKLKDRVPKDVCDRVRAHFEALLESLGFDNKLLVLDGGISLEVVSRAPEAAA
jgi:pyruvate kinase